MNDDLSQRFQGFIQKIQDPQQRRAIAEQLASTMAPPSQQDLFLPPQGQSLNQMIAPQQGVGQLQPAAPQPTLPAPPQQGLPPQILQMLMGGRQ